MPYLRNSIAYDHYFWYTCVKMMIAPGAFFKFPKFWFSRLLGGGGLKGKKTVQNDKKFCLLQSITEKTYMIWLSFMVISSTAFFFYFFKILILWVHSGLKGLKTVYNDKTFCLSHSISQEPYIIWLWFLIHMCKMMISPANFFIY